VQSKRQKRDQLTLNGFQSKPKNLMALYKTVLDKFAPTEMVALRGTSEMKKEVSETFRGAIAESHELIKQSKALAGELKETVERSRFVLDESYSLTDRLKARSFLRDDPKR
jgi:hypothetical protein